MATGDLMTRLLLNSSQFDNNLSKSAKQVQQFQRTANQVGTKVNNVFSSMGTMALKAAPQIGALMGAYEALNKTIGSTQTLTDNFGRTMASCEGIVNSFFSALANGSFQGFIDGLNDVITTAREAYNAMDDLGTFMIFKNPKVAEINRDISKAKYNIKAGINVEANKESIKNLEKQLQDITREESTKANDTYVSVMRSNLAQQSSGAYVPTEKEIKKVFGSYDSYMSYENKYQDLIKKREALQNRIAKGTTTTYGMGGVSYKGLNADAQKATDELKKLEDSNKALIAIHEIGDEKLKEGFKYRLQAATAEDQLYQKMASDLKVLNKAATTPKASGGRKTTPTTTSAPIPMGDMQGINTSSLDPNTLGYYTDRVERLKKALNDPTLTATKYAEIRVKLTKAEEDLDNFKNNSFGKFDIEPIDASKILGDLEADRINAYTEALERAKIAQEGLQSTINAMGSSFSSLGQAIGGTTGNVLEMAGATMQAIAQIIPQIISLIGVQEAEALAAGTASGAGLPFPANIAAIAGIIATITALFASFAGKFANGGIVGGGSLHGDMNLARVNSGEMILNGTQQKNLFTLLNSGNPTQVEGGGSVHFKIQGKDLVGVLNNYNKKTSKVI